MDGVLEFLSFNLESQRLPRVGSLAAVEDDVELQCDLVGEVGALDLEPRGLKELAYSTLHRGDIEAGR